MVVEAEFARLTVARRVASITLECALALSGLAYSANAAASAEYAVAASAAPSLIALEEQNLPPEDLSSPAASAAASPAASPAPQGGAQAPAASGATLAPNAQASPEADVGGASGGGSEWTRVPNEAGGASAPDSAGADAATGAPIADKPMPQATPTDAPLPYDVGSIQPTTPVSDKPLTGLIASTQDQPALNASLRFAEQGRKSLETSKLDDAIRELGRAISIDPTDPYSYFYLGRAYMLKKDYTQALAFF